MARLGIFASFAGVISGDSETMGPTVVVVGLASPGDGVGWLDSDHQVFKRGDFAKGRF